MRFFNELFLNRRFFYTLGVAAFLYVAGFYMSALTILGHVAVILTFILTAADVYLLFRTRHPCIASRILPDIVTLGDDIDVTIPLQNRTSIPLHFTVLDELPYQTDLRDLVLTADLGPDKKNRLRYTVTPVERGEYEWGYLQIHTSSKLAFITRKYTVSASVTAKVYPSVLQMRKYELLAFHQNAVMPGLKRMRKIGQSLEFEQIRRYTEGDDYRRINWKATSRKRELMVNSYRDERSQNIYSVIDLSRNMGTTFNQMSLLDYAINTSLMISNVALKKEDKAGLITFGEKICDIVPASRNRKQINVILETLYNQEYRHLEGDFKHLYSYVSRSVKQRSLMIIYTNFDHVSSMERSLDMLRKLARRHLVVVVIFENTAVHDIIESEARTLKELFVRTIAEKHVLEKAQIVSELQKYGIQTILTNPEKLSVSTLNKYLELKARRMI